MSRGVSDLRLRLILRSGSRRRRSIPQGRLRPAAQLPFRLPLYVFDDEDWRLLEIVVADANNR